MCLAVVGIYLGKNGYFKQDNPKEQAKVEKQKEKKQDSNKPSLLEFSTET